MPAGSATDGLHCNVDADRPPGHLGRLQGPGATSTPAGHECAFYDTALLFPLNALKLDASSPGVAVLDMSDPAHPVQTATLTELADALAARVAEPQPEARAARGGAPATRRPTPGSSRSTTSARTAATRCCSRPSRSRGSATRAASRPTARRSTRPAPRCESITAIDVTDPKHPHAVWQGNVVSHGMTLSDDGNRAYVADPTGGNMLILDVSQIQARKPNPQVREISRLTWHARLDPAERDPVHRARPPVRARVRRVHAGHATGVRRPEHGRRRRGSSTSPTRRRRA